MGGGSGWREGERHRGRGREKGRGRREGPDGGGVRRGAQSLARLPFHYWLIMSLKPLRTSSCALFAHVVFCGVCARVCVCLSVCIRTEVRKASSVCGAVHQQQQQQPPPDSRAKLLESRECPRRAEGSLNSVCTLCCRA